MKLNSLGQTSEACFITIIDKIVLTQRHPIRQLDFDEYFCRS